jgi:DNA repair ATPase RecN
MTPEQLLQQIVERQAINTQAIADLNQSVGFLVGEFIRPNAQQAAANYERLERLEGIVEGIVNQLEETLTLTASNTQAISTLTQLAEGQQQRMDAFDSRLEETRSLVADNASQIAQLRQQQGNSQQQIDQLGIRVDDLVARSERSLEETEALKELSRSQLAAIIANGRRIDRLEQQAS